MANTIVLGLQWGDEGKGKIVDLVCPAFDAVARYQGGHNAGHTVKFGDQHFALHFFPSGILSPHVTCVLGNGMVISPPAFFEELAMLEANGVDATGRLFVSDRAHVILPAHAALDVAREEARGDAKIGTTARGIGPAYESKIARSGIRCGELLSSGLEERLDLQQRHLDAQLRVLGAEPSEHQNLAATCREWGKQLEPYLVDSARWLNQRIADGGQVLFEGAQGALLDIDHGTFPFVTSSNSTAGGVCTGAGVPPTKIGSVLGIIKAYTTRVGSGPFVTELFDEHGEHLQERGHEIGTSTGRPRRCGWFDAVIGRYSSMLNGVTAIALTKIDVLDELEEIKVCTAYRYRGEELRDFPSSIEVLEACEPIYETLPGWQSSTVGILDARELPENARNYIRFIEEQIGASAVIISTGPRREETILVDSPALDRMLGSRAAAVIEHRGC